MNVSHTVKHSTLATGEFEHELKHILAYWSDTVFDHANGRFHPKVDHTDTPHPQAITGSVMYARILWAFSAGYSHTAIPRYRELADIAFQYIRQYLLDPEYGGVYWSVHPDGSPADSRKQTYAIAFAIYGLAEYYKVHADHAVLALAQELYLAIEQHGWDSRHGGYIEAFERDWRATTQLQLSAKDQNEKKTLNTHLHLLEAYTNLYNVWPNETLKQQIDAILGLFKNYFVSPHGHLTLFFDEQWHAKSLLRSFGHEIETSWLLCEASQVTNDGLLADSVRDLSLRLANASLKWAGKSGALPYEFDATTNGLVAEKHWWVQAEALVGFYRAGRLSGDSRYTAAANRTWQYITENLIDRERGEWYWGRDEQGRIMDHEDKAGFWKCPYHNTRCCLQMIQLLGESPTNHES
ncbi:AGE family epimerase/isomerase [Parapedobacter soli]|uniref:AGE family epimerase/isomerase n=1 Tax=Parapedobacter soli TaxID=416955 RepID=UPI0021C90DC6|nr:AGE family epimerase/isomerase [Parapedobacter soli]